MKPLITFLEYPLNLKKKTLKSKELLIMDKKNKCWRSNDEPRSLEFFSACIEKVRDISFKNLDKFSMRMVPE